MIQTFNWGEFYKGKMGKYDSNFIKQKERIR
jgi:hypothetical protein